MAQKAKSGGTHGVAPIGYVNTLARVDGREEKGVALDNERAPHIRWSFKTYAEGNWSISALRDALEERGLRSRVTQRYRGTPLSDAQVHLFLKNPYYIGKIVYQGVILDGEHEPLIDEKTWFRCQDLLAGRRIAGDRSWKLNHPLKAVAPLQALRRTHGIRQIARQRRRLRVLLLPRPSHRTHRMRSALHRCREGGVGGPHRMAREGVALD